MELSKFIWNIFEIIFSTMAFGLELKRLREEANISAQKLADFIGIDADRLRKWEQRDLNPRLDDAQKIEAYFGMSLLELSKLKSIKKFLIVPREVPDQGGANVSDLLGVLVQLMKTQNHILEEQKEDLKDRVKRIDVNLSDALGRVDGLQFDLVSGRQVVLESLARLEGRAEKALLKQADSIKRALFAELQKPSTQTSKGK